MRFKNVISWGLVLLLFSGLKLYSQNPWDMQIITLSGRVTPEKALPGEKMIIEVIAQIEPGFHINSTQPTEEYLIPTVVKFDPLDDLTFGEPEYPEPKMAKFIFSEDELSVYDDELVVRCSVTLNQDISAGSKLITGSFSFQACNDVNCFAPQTLNFEIPFEVMVGEKGAASTADQTTFTTSIVDTNGELITGEIVKQERPDLKVNFTSDELKAKEIIEKGLPYAIIAFFIFGLALNLTPCVYPVIPLTVGYFGGQSQRKKGPAFLMASFYVIGIAIVFAVLGLISGLAGKQWGFLFQDPWFVIVVTTIILAMAASMFGAFEITVPSFLSASLGKSRQGNIGALVMGLTVGVVIAPCAAGIIIGLVGLVAKLGIVAKGTLLFFIMGLGLGLPYLFLATFSGLLNKLPQSGMWMVWVRKLFGVLLIGVALYFFLPQAKHVADQQGFFFGLLTIFGGLLLGFLDQTPGYTKNFKIGRGVFGILLIILGIFWVHNAINAKPSEIDWVHYE
ncbi:MAG: cytochrome c biogenesis protein CcdA, partial [bacterium]|nr:cytochrome c biogenesis protein CcdA [bacterium]